jgi:hypothetical protein
MRYPKCGRWLIGAAILAGASAQTRVDLRSQARNVDFSAVPAKPFRTGTALPAACSVGETFFKTDGPPGKNFYGCTSANTWTLEAPGDLPDATGQTGRILTNDGSSPRWTSILGDISGHPGSLVVGGLQGRAVSPAAPAAGDALRWNSVSNQWEAGAVSTTLAGDAAGPMSSTAVRALQGRPVSAAAPTGGQALKWNAGSNQWEPGTPDTTLAGDASGPVGVTVVRALQGRAIATAAPADGQALKWNGAARQWEPGNPATTLSGDAGGPADRTVVQALQGRPVAGDAPADGQALKWNATFGRWEPGAPNTTLAGDAAGPAGTTTVKALQGHAVSASSPLDGQALKWNGTFNQWEPGTPNTTLSGDAAGPAGTTTVKGLQGRAVATAAPADGYALEWNGSASQWEPRPVIGSASGDVNGPLSNVVVQRLQGRAVSAASPSDGQALVWNATVSQWQPAAGGAALVGDASGPVGNTTVKGLQGRTVSASNPSDGQALKWNGNSNQWEPGAVTVNLAGDSNGPAGTNVVRGLQGRTVSAAAPSDGQALVWNAAAGQWQPAASGGTLAGDSSGPAATNVVRGLQGRTVSAAAPSDGQALKWNGASSQWEPGTPDANLAGDASGPSTATVVRGLQGRAVSASVPSDGQTLRWNASLGQWEPGGTTDNYSAAFTSQTSVTIAGSAHGYKSANLLVQCFDTGTSIVVPYSVAINSSSYDVTIGFSAPQSGRCVVNGGGPGGTGTGTGGGSSSVASVFGRTGVITAQPGDYSFPQITGSVANSQVGTGIDAGKIGAGTVSSAAFGYLASARSDLQAQIDGKASLGHSHATGGDLAGDLGSAVVAAVQGRPVSAAVPQDGQVLTWNAPAARWEPRAAGGTGGSLSVLSVARVSDAVLSIGAECSAAAPCNVRFGSTVYSIQAPSTATLTGGTGTAYIYGDQNGVVTLGHDLALTCSGGCQAEAGVTGFPNDTIPLAIWDASDGVWSPQGRDSRAWLSTRVMIPGQGLMTVDNGSTTTVAVDAAVVPTYLAGSATLDFPAVFNGACTADMSIPVSGAAPGESVAPGWPSTLPKGLFGMMFVGEANVVSVRLCNLSGMPLDAPPSVFTATILRSF